MMHALPFRLSKKQHIVIRLLAVFAVLAALIASGLAVIPGPTPAQAQTQNIPVSPAKQDFSNTATQNTYTFTVDADATMNSLDFNVTGNYFLLEYNLMVNGRSLKKETFSSSQKLPYSKTVSGLNSPLKKGDKIDLYLRFNFPREQGTVSMTPKGTLGGSTPTPTPTPTQPTPTPTPTSTPDPSDKTVTPAAPTAVDPATAPQCVEKGYINIPGTQGVDYYIAGQKKPAGQHFFEGTKPATVKVTAKAQSGYQIASGATTEWSFNMSGEVKNCSGDQPTPPPDGRTFKATGHGFSLQGDPVAPNRPDTFTAKVGEDAKLNYITVRIKTDATFLDPQHYQLTVDKIEDGVTLQKRNVNIGNGYITMDVVPMKDGKQVDSAFLPKDAVFTFTNNLAQNKSLVVELDAYGTKSADPTDPPIISPPDGADWVHGRVANPQLPMTCGLRIAVVADLSTSLNYADNTNGFDESKKATNAFIDALAGTSAELGLYNFASTAPANVPGSTHGNNPPYISMLTQDGVTQAKRVVSNWNFNQNNSATNWQAGLQQVKAGNYDVVYFITDGMPTTSSTIKSKGIGGEFVQASALNDAIDAANELKASGTRVVPLMVDLTLGGRTSQRPVVTNDLVLKDAKRIGWQADPGQAPGLYYKIRSDHPKAIHANYINTDILVNLKMAYDGAGNQTLQVVERLPNGRQETITSKMSRWTYGTRDVKVMGEDISGTGDTVRITNYSGLAAQMKSIAQDLTKKCGGEVIVKKRIVDEDGKVLSDSEPGWEFTLSANGQKVIDPGNGELVTQWRKATSWREEDKGTARWGIQSETAQDLTLTETQQAGYTLFKRDGKNAVCQETRDGKTTSIAVQNDGEFGFKVRMNEKDKVLSRVSCVVDNYKTPEATGKLTFKKAQYVDGEVVEMSDLGGATFEIYPAKDGKPDYSAGKPLYTIKPGQESIEVKTTGTFFLVETKAPNGLNLLPKPVPFEIAFDKDAKKYRVSTVGNHPQLKASGSGDAMLLVVADTASGQLPKTGGNGVLVWALGGLVMAGGGALWMRRRKS
ncbi:LPXTG-motif cell wall-anchored protein [Brevibacterium paucivorans]|uniref:LPXTG-motif cell wall-anchored protein n=1 Tax=Brevibacterium paucivorans TaxID=170994 RepID=A0ABS2SKY4_9MICO|nr:SpaA isopeptide-forming pilin-related protein [Brevibacterium paucivorans]MBM7816921.1 LPXTG-motif cell wall-anchored protein [Brevibacterium paucivorans]